MQCSQGDGSLLSSDGIYVDLSGASAISAPESGDSIEITAYVEERGDFPAQPLTCLSNIQEIIVHSSNNALPAALSISRLPDKRHELGNLTERHEMFEGMRVSMSGGGIVVAPSDTNGRLGLRLSGNIYENGARGPIVVRSEAEQEVNYHPHAAMVGSRLLSEALLVRVGDTIASLNGVIDYRDGVYLFQALPGEMPVSYGPLEASPAPVSSRISTSGSTIITTMSFGAFFDTLDDANTDDIVSSPAEYRARFTKAKRAIIDELSLPKLLMVQGVESDSMLLRLADSINDEKNHGYKSIYYKTSDARGLGCGFIYDSVYWDSASAFLMSGDAVDSVFGDESGNPGCEPLIGDFFYTATKKITVLNVDLVARDASPLFGVTCPPVRSKEALRVRQATVIRDWLDSLFNEDSTSEVIVAGNFSDYPFNEDRELRNAVAIIKAGENSSLVSVWDSLPQYARYTHIEQGRGGMFTHMLLSGNLAQKALACNTLHFNSLFEETFATDPSSGVRVSNFDALEVRFW